MALQALQEESTGRARSGGEPENGEGVWQHRKAGRGVVGGLFGLGSGSIVLLCGAIIGVGVSDVSLVVSRVHSGSSGAILGGLFRALLAR